MNKAKLFLENFIIYGFGSIISKIIPFVMIPIATRLMPSSSYYGISDMSDTIVSLCSSLAIMGMYDAMYRMFFEKEDEKFQKVICSTAFIFTMITSVIVFVVMILLRNFIAESFMGNREYSYLIYITATATLVGATNSIVAAPTRMQNKRKTYIFINTLSSFVSFGIAILLLLTGHYLIALPLAGMLAALSSEIIYFVLNRKWFSFFDFDFHQLKELLKIGVPLIPNFLIYWIFNSCDKLMILHIMDDSAMGIYSAGAKIGLASQLIYMAFAGGWQFFAFSTMKEEKQVENNSKVFEYLGVISFGVSSLVIAVIPVVFRILFTAEYYDGYIVVPYLFIAPLLQMLFQVACNQFLVIKKTWPNLFILAGGAVINIILNLLLIPKIGIEGAAIATMTGYIISDIVAVIVLCRMKLMVVHNKFIMVTLCMVAFFLLWRFSLKDAVMISSFIAILYIVFLCVCYKRDLALLIGSFKREEN